MCCDVPEMTLSQILSLFSILQHFNLRLKSPSCIIPCPFPPCLPAEVAAPAGTNATRICCCCRCLFFFYGFLENFLEQLIKLMAKQPPGCTEIQLKSYLYLGNSLKQKKWEKMSSFPRNVQKYPTFVFFSFANTKMKNVPFHLSAFTVNAYRWKKCILLLCILSSVWRQWNNGGKFWVRADYYNYFFFSLKNNPIIFQGYYERLLSF